MGAITYHETTTGVTSSSTTSHSIIAPATVNAGDLMILTIAWDGNPTVTKHADWTQLDETGEGNVKLSCYYRIADGSEDSASYTWTTDVNETAAWHIRRFSGWHGTTPPEIGVAFTSAATDSPDPPSLTPSWGAEDTNMYVAVEGNDSDETATAYPTDYTDGVTNNAAGGGGNCGCSTAIRSINGSPENPGVFTLNGTEQVVAQTIAIRPSTGGAATSLVIPNRLRRNTLLRM